MSVEDIANQSSVIFEHDWVHDSQGSAETVISIFFQQYFCEKLPKSVDVH